MYMKAYYRVLIIDLEHNCLQKTETFKNACNGCANPDQLQNALKSTDWSTSYRLV